MAGIDGRLGTEGAHFADALIDPSAPTRFDVCLVNLDPTIGSEIRKTRPCVVISPNEMKHNIRTVIVAPMTTQGRPYTTRVPCRFNRKKGLIVLDQIRTVDAARLVKMVGRVGPKTGRVVLGVPQEILAP